MRTQIKKIIIALPALISIPIIILKLLPIQTNFLPENIFDILALSCLVGITGSLFVLDNENLISGFNSLQAKVSDAFLFSKGNVTVVRPANEPTIWIGFKKKMYALNPPLKMNKASISDYSEMVASHAKRFNDSEFNVAHYIFFTKGEDGRYFINALDDFIAFMKDVRKLSIHVNEKVKVTIVDEDAPGFTFFVGEKAMVTAQGQHKCSYAITYVNEVPLVYKNGFSNWAFISLNEEYNTTLENYCLDIVNRYEWQNFRRFLSEQDVRNVPKNNK